MSVGPERIESKTWAARRGLVVFVAGVVLLAFAGLVLLLALLGGSAQVTSTVTCALPPKSASRRTSPAKASKTTPATKTTRPRLAAQVFDSIRSGPTLIDSDNPDVEFRS